MIILTGSAKPSRLYGVDILQSQKIVLALWLERSLLRPITQELSSVLFLPHVTL